LSNEFLLKLFFKKLTENQNLSNEFLLKLFFKKLEPKPFKG
jgi:hypothetical protein